MDPIARPIAHASRAAIQAPAKEEKEEKDAKDDADDAHSDVDSRFVLDASVPNGNFKPAVEGPKLPARNKLSFNQMSSSYGKGWESTTTASRILLRCKSGRASVRCKMMGRWWIKTSMEMKVGKLERW